MASAKTSHQASLPDSASAPSSFHCIIRVQAKSPHYAAIAISGRAQKTQQTLHTVVGHLTPEACAGSPSSNFGPGGVVQQPGSGGFPSQGPAAAGHVGHEGYTELLVHEHGILKDSGMVLQIFRGGSRMRKVLWGR